MGAIKLPVHCDGNVPGDIMDADYRIVAACEDPDDAPLIVAALTDRPILLARVEELEGALAGIREFAQEMVNGFAADIQEGLDGIEASKNAAPWNAVLAALSRVEG